MLQFIQVVDFLYTNILVMECKLFYVLDTNKISVLSEKYYGSMVLFVDIIIYIVRQRIEYTFAKKFAPLTINLPRFWKRFIA